MGIQRYRINRVREEGVGGLAVAPGGEEHLLPLHVVAGAAFDDESGTKLWTEPDFFGRVTMSSWGFSM